MPGVTGGILPVRLPGAEQAPLRPAGGPLLDIVRCADGAVAARGGGRRHNTVTLLPRSSDGSRLGKRDKQLKGPERTALSATRESQCEQ
jgi:hypothetical protein